MATLQYTVFETAGSTAQGDPIQEGVITIAGASDQSDVIVGSGNKRRSVRIAVDSDCWVTWGEDPTALTDGTAGRMMGTQVSTVEYFNIQSGHKIAVIQRT